MSRPEYQLPPHLYYNIDEANKYTNCSRIIHIQSELTERALQLLNLSTDECPMVLDIGCGSGISGHQLTEEGIQWVGLDISRSMLDIAIQRRVQGELLECDIGQGFRFRPGVFDAAISISAIQWLCVSYQKSEVPFKRLSRFFDSLKNALRHGARAVLQFYPDGNEQLTMITNAALKSGFSGSVIVDYPHSAKAKKLYLVLSLGISEQATINVIEGIKEEARDQGEKQVDFITKLQKKIKKPQKDHKPKEKSKKWIKRMKQRQVQQGKAVKPDSKFSGRRRRNLAGFT